MPVDISKARFVTGSPDMRAHTIIITSAHSVNLSCCRYSQSSPAKSVLVDAAMVVESATTSYSDIVTTLYGHKTIDLEAN